MAIRKRTKSRIALGVAAAALAVAATLVGYLIYCASAAQTAPSPGLTAEEAEAAKDSDRFPQVDWDYWQGVNDDVIGWITVPGTTIDAPILQAPVDEPDYYLHHDVYRNLNPYGAIYLDAECIEDGLASRNAVIMGHHFTSDTTYANAPFGILAEYRDQAFAADHATVLLQTPESKMVYEVRFVQIVNGGERSKRTTFTDDSDYRNWYDNARADAVTVLDDSTEPDQTISLVTCSYNIWVENERTVVITSPRHENIQLLAQNQSENTAIALDGL